VGTDERFQRAQRTGHVVGPSVGDGVCPNGSGIDEVASAVGHQHALRAEVAVGQSRIVHPVKEVEDGVGVRVDGLRVEFVERPKLPQIPEDDDAQPLVLERLDGFGGVDPQFAHPLGGLEFVFGHLAGVPKRSKKPAVPEETAPMLRPVVSSAWTRECCDVMTFTNQRSSMTVGVESQLSASRKRTWPAGRSCRESTARATPSSCGHGTVPRRSRRNDTSWRRRGRLIDVVSHMVFVDRDQT
jgi:hypothetical protein